MILISKISNVTDTAKQMNVKSEWQGEGVQTKETPNPYSSGLHIVIEPPKSVKSLFADDHNVHDAHLTSIRLMMKYIERDGVCAFVRTNAGFDIFESDNLTYKIFDHSGRTDILIANITYFGNQTCTIDPINLLKTIEENAYNAYLVELAWELQRLGYKLGLGPAFNIEDLREWPSLNSLRG